MPKSKVRKKKKSSRKDYIRNESKEQMSLEQMSAIIVDYISPLIESHEEENNESDITSIVALGAFAWNLSLLPKKQREEETVKFCEDYKKETNLDEEEARAILEFLIQRKNEEFGHIKQFI